MPWHRFGLLLRSLNSLPSLICPSSYDEGPEAHVRNSCRLWHQARSAPHNTTGGSKCCLKVFLQMGQKTINNGSELFFQLIYCICRKKEQRIKCHSLIYCHFNYFFTTQLIDYKVEGRSFFKYNFMKRKRRRETYRILRFCWDWQ